MSGSTPNLDLEYLDASQSQPEVKVNDAWDKIDAAVGGGGSSPVSVSDGTTAVENITAIRFTNGATVSEASSGVADVYIDPVSGGSGGGGGNVGPDTHPTSPPAVDDEFEEGSLSGWTWLNQGTSTAVLADGHVILTTRMDVGSGPSTGPRNVSGFYRSLPGGSAWKIRARFANDVTTTPSDSGLMLYESGSGKVNGFCHYLSSSTLELAIISFSSTAVITGVDHQAASPFANAFSLGPPFMAQSTPHGYFEIELAAGQLIYRVSNTGVEGSFKQWYTQAVTGPFTTAPDKVGLYGESYNQTSPAILFCDYVRQISP